MLENVRPFLEIIRYFHASGIRFVLIGGVAMAAHGSNYVTTDVDFVYAVDPENLERLASLLKTIHARVLGRPAGDGFVILPTALQQVRFLNLFTDLGELDIMRQVAGVDSFEGLFDRSTEMDFGGFMVHVASLDDLIAMKRAANRLKDQNHLLELLALKKLIETEGDEPR